MATSGPDLAGTQARNVEMARRGFGAWMRGDIDGALAVLTEDIEIYVPQELGNAGTYRGHTGFLSWVAQWEEAWSEFTYEIREMRPVGERHVVASVYNKGRGKSSGIEIEQTLGWVFGIRDDLCEFLSLQQDLPHALELAHEREASGPRQGDG
jgi:ketosteroid isomerase-like protein